MRDELGTGNYVVGFVFDPAVEFVVLIAKKKPRWQRGMFNGVGGSIEAGESPLYAMQREFFEETGVTVFEESWREFAYMEAFNGDVSKKATVTFFTAKDPQAKLATSKTHEEVIALPLTLLPYVKTVAHVPWLIHMALSPNPLVKRYEFQEIPR